MRLYFLAQSNLWTLLASLANQESQHPSHSRNSAEEAYYPFSYFIQHSISKNAPARDSDAPPELTLQSELYSAETPVSTSRVRESVDEETSTCQQQRTKEGIETYVITPAHSLTVTNREELLFEFDQIKVLVTTKPSRVGMVFCSGSIYKVIGHPVNQRPFFVREYSTDGKLLVNHRLVLPAKKFEGNYRKILSFKNTRTTYEFDIADMKRDRVLRAYRLVASKPNE